MDTACVWTVWDTWGTTPQTHLFAVHTAGLIFNRTSRRRRATRWPTLQRTSGWTRGGGYLHYTTFLYITLLCDLFLVKNTSLLLTPDFSLQEKEAECVHCDRCPNRRTPAVNTCLKCELSLCREHVKEHLELRAFTGHPLVPPLSDLRDRKCPQHEDAVLRYYCSSSRRYICNICALESTQLSMASEASIVLRRQLTVSWLALWHRLFQTTCGDEVIFM